MIKKGFSLIAILFLKILSYLPFGVLYFLADLCFYPLFYVFKYRRKVVKANLSKAFPEKSDAELAAIEYKFYRHLTDVIFETVKSWSISKKEILKRLQFSGTEVLEPYYASGQNVIFCTGHYCNWEMIALGLGLQHKARMVVIYKPLSNKWFEEWFKRLRMRFGAVFVPMRQTLRAIQTYTSSTTFCFACDQSPCKEEAKYFLDFLNQPTAALLGLEKIATRTGYPVFYFKTNRIKRGYYSAECIPLEMKPGGTQPFELTKKHFGMLEDIIREQPEYWLWSHKRWKYQPEPLVALS